MKSSAKILHFFWLQRRKINPAYSMRALARDLDLSQSYVSEIINGKKRLTPSMLSRWSRVLKIDSLGVDSIKRALIEEFSPEPKARKSKSPVTSASETWDLESPSDLLLQRWYHVVILELLNTDCQDFTPAVVAKRVGISAEQATGALLLLQEQGYVRTVQGRLVKTKQKLRLPTAKSLAVIRNFHRQMIELSLLELRNKSDAQSFARRLISGITVSANPLQIEKAKAHLQKALHETADILMQGPCTDVMQLNVQLFSHLNSPT